jgi:hypothetical protein
MAVWWALIARVVVMWRLGEVAPVCSVVDPGRSRGGDVAPE